jgi:hypothetical protein
MMGVRCEKCGHENDAKFHFCGMCGEPLPSVPWQKEDTSDGLEPPSNLPSSVLFPPTGELDTADRAAYLLSDEEEDHPRHTGRLYLALVLLIISLVLLAIHWRQYAHGWLTAYVARSAATNPDEGTNEGREAPVPVATPSSPSPPAQPPSKAPEKSSKLSSGVSVVPSPESVPVSSVRLPADLPGQDPASPASQQEPSAQTAANPTLAATTSSPSRAKAEATQRATHSAPADAAQPIAGESPATQGERYLYGNGVPQDCALARKNLAIAAERKNSRALTLMGTMYATGHCAPRDLPTAYNWFARALRADPANHHVEDELSLIWKQMTPSEKQLALKK